MGKTASNNPLLNPHRPLLKRKAFAFLLVFFLAAKIAVNLLLPQRSTQASDLTIGNILQAINQQRQMRNLVTLNTNDKLSAAAQSKSDDMIARHYFAHVDPEGHYIWDKIVAEGYTPYLQLGENLAIEFYDTDSLINAWMNSSEHRANILNDGFRDQGMGLGFGNVSQNQYYSAITNTFGTLAPIAQAKTPPATPQPTTQTPPAPKTNTATSTPAKTTPTPTAPPPAKTPTVATGTPLATSSPATTTAVQQPIEPRAGLQTENNTTTSFALPQGTKGQSTGTPQAPSLPQKANNFSASAVIGAPDLSTYNNYQVTRYLILICGVCLLLLMLSDIK